MRIPVIKGVIDRRILVNYRVDPEAIARVLPPPFRPKLHAGHAVAGICLIRLRDIRPRFLPRIVGISSENAAHRIAVEWDTPAGPREGVFIPRRDSSSRLNTLLGGRVFPGMHHLARFDSIEDNGRYAIQMHSRDGVTSLTLEAEHADVVPAGSLFRNVAEASAFFERGALGYSVTRTPSEFDGLELRCRNWRVQPLAVSAVHSSFFADGACFPKGSVEFDCALLMRDIAHEWRRCESICGDQLKSGTA
jgi:uncharacterized protein YqjF (DUF2071 family)